jgi:S-adenosylmethionine:tRNA ribosyltransferase-isomerase
VGAAFGVEGEFAAQVREKSATAEYRVAFMPARAGESVAALAERLGRVPLPPYIHRSGSGSGSGSEADKTVAKEDRDRYQTVFADREHTVAVAAPTAGLHFTEPLLAQLAGRGIEFADVVLHVGLGTFRPIETDEVAAHPIHRETVEVPATAAAKLRASRTGRRIAVGTTSVRTVEHWARAVTRDPAAAESAPAGDAGYAGEADLFIHPPAEFRVVEGLITNFHLPRSTLLCLVASFLTPGSTDGVAWLREIYAEAIRERYRFLSYGDAMLIV